MVADSNVAAFSLDHPIGEGGMAEIWKGRHRESDTPVAVKIVTRQTVGATGQLFEQELRATAELNHPGIVDIYEYGRLNADQLAQIPGDVPDEAPYIVMELAEKGSLAAHWSDIRDWPSLRRLLFRLLDALAYAHARKVVHRDIKPENILLFRGDDGVDCKLTDFGLAQALEPEASPDTENLEGIQAGTPFYMPPEQLQGEWREFGPWTDLYALGCTAYELATGSPPFTGRLNEVMVAHMTREPPALEPAFPIPDAFEDWLFRCLAKAPDDRFARAADATRSLRDIVGTSELDPSIVEGRNAGFDGTGESAPTLQLDDETRPTLESAAPTQPDATGFADTLAAIDESQAGADADDSGSPDGSGAPVETRVDAPALPDSWQSLQRHHDRRLPHGAGLELFGLREIPFVDREQERDALWEALRQAASEGEPVCVLLRGETGRGKTRLATWLRRCVHASGLGSVFEIGHSPHGGLSTGLRGMLERAFVAWGLDKAEIFERVRETLPRFLQSPSDGADATPTDERARAITEIIRPTPSTQVQWTDSESEPMFSFQSTTERYAVVRRLLVAACRRRPGVLSAEDLHWGPRTLDFIEYLLEEPFSGLGTDALPLLIVGTIDDDTPDFALDADERLARLTERDRVREIRVGRLEEADHMELIQQSFPLEQTLADKISRRTAGNPLAVVQLLRSWADHELLEPGDDGFRLDPEADFRIPDDLYELWVERLNRFAAGHDSRSTSDVWTVLATGAALGKRFRDDEWRQACQLAGIAIDDTLTDALVKSGYWKRDGDAWVFDRGMMRESIVEHARSSGRWAEVNGVCADMLAQRYASEVRGLSRRRSEHLIEAGRPREAIEALKDAIVEATAIGANDEATNMLEKRQRLVDEHDIDHEGQVAVQNWRLEASIHREAGDSSRARDLVQRALDRAEAHDFRGERVRLLNLKASLLYLENRFDEARQCATEAGEILSTDDDPEGVAESERLLGAGHFYVGNYDQARSHLFRALDIYKTYDSDLNTALVLTRLGTVGAAENDYDRAARWFERAAEIAEKTGDRLVEADCLNGLGNIARARGELDRAEELFDAAADRWQLSEHRDYYLARANQALVAIERGAFDRSRELLETIRPPLERQEYASLLVYVALGLACCAAARGDEDVWDAAFSRAESTLRDREIADDDLLWLAELTAELARDAGWGRRVDRCDELVELQESRT